ncbi:MAG2960 family serine endopeptidase lipoprotein [Mycoplasma sp. 'Moose RK']|uniref:MAG2960 family serine endopeptidase lipoprotein n=1 Tax=Mycoplasma sp. 'Moose RK' TaxID=2780095 RepID=UPI0018C32B28|nr:lipoprotein [Mycoplasma sp. 'Moose RK']MBG0730638.1 lipoprotein [Mycoplasma sp. 'Moose RK']
MKIRKQYKILVFLSFFVVQTLVISSCYTKISSNNEKNLLSAEIEKNESIKLQDLEWDHIKFDYNKQNFTLKKIEIIKNNLKNQAQVFVGLVDNKTNQILKKSFVFTGFFQDKEEKNPVNSVQEKSDLNLNPKITQEKKQKISQNSDIKTKKEPKIDLPRPKPDFQNNLPKNPEKTPAIKRNPPISSPKYLENNRKFDSNSGSSDLPTRKQEIPAVTFPKNKSISFKNIFDKHFLGKKSGLSYENGKIYSISDQKYFADQHYFDLDFLQRNTAYSIIQSTPKWQTSLHNMYYFLNNYDGRKVSFLEPNDERKNNEFWEHTKNLGVYGEFGENDTEKLMFYNRGLSYRGMMEQVFLPTFSEQEAQNATEIEKNISDLISKNPFGFLPSNLSQLFYYMKLTDIEKIFQFTNLVSIKTNFDDKKGEIKILFLTKNGEKKLWKSSSSNANSLKKDLDFQQYIYDRSFLIGLNSIRWHRDSFFPRLQGLKAEQNFGTAWVIDRIIDKNQQRQDEFEILVATNIHVWEWQKTFDKTAIFNPILNDSRANEWNAGFYDYATLPQTIKKNNEDYAVIPEQTGNEFFVASRGKNPTPENNQENFVSHSDNNKANYYPIFNAKLNYLDGTFYTPRYKVTGLMGADVDVGWKYLDNYDEITRVGSTKNGGADFVILKLKISRQNLKIILPELEKIIGTDKEKDWYVGLGKNEKFTPMKTQFYGGYPVFSTDNEHPDWSKGFHFKSNKSKGGIVNTRNRVITEELFLPLWKRYNESENRDWNSKHEKWKNYLKPFRDSLEHGMLNLVLNQHSHLYTKIDPQNKQNALGPGSSGSMAIDSSFNLIGINFTYSKDTAMNTYSNAISLMEGLSTYEDDFDGNIRLDFARKLKEKNIFTVKINPVNS